MAKKKKESEPQPPTPAPALPPVAPTPARHQPPAKRKRLSGQELKDLLRQERRETRLKTKGYYHEMAQID